LLRRGVPVEGEMTVKMIGGLPKKGKSEGGKKKKKNSRKEEGLEGAATP